MRTFVLYARKALTDGKFNLDSLPSAGRMDLVCRSISSCLFLSYNKRENTRIFVVMNGPPKPPITLCFDSNSNFYPDEVSIAKAIRERLSEEIGDEWEDKNGIKASRKSFQEIMRELEGNVYVLHEKGDAIKKMKENPIFVLGDNIGIPNNEEKRILKNGEKMSLGKIKYLTSTCISVLNWICDQYDID